MGRRRDKDIVPLGLSPFERGVELAAVVVDVVEVVVVVVVVLEFAVVNLEVAADLGGCEVDFELGFDFE